MRIARVDRLMDPTFATYAVTLNGRTVLPATRAAIVDGRLLLPLRPLAEVLDAKIVYDGPTHTVTIERDTQTTKVGPRDGVLVALGHAYAPLRSVADAFGFSVGFDADSHTVALSSLRLPTMEPEAPAPRNTPYSTYQAQGVATLGPQALAAQPTATPLITQAYVDGPVAPGARAFDVVVYGPPGLFGRVAVEGIPHAFPLIVDGATRYVAHIVVPLGTRVPYAHVAVRVQAPGRGEVTLNLKERVPLLVPPATPSPSPTPARRAPL